MMRNRILTALLAGVLLPAAAQAQDAVEGRVDRLEREMRAVQRTVFPGGAGKYVSPEITAPDATGALPGTPASSPAADLDSRIVALERQQATLTGQIEQAQFRLRQLEDSFAAYKRANETKPGTGEPVALLPAASEPAVVKPAKPAPVAAKPASTIAKPATSTTAKPGGDPERAARLAEIERPTTDDPAEDSYLYGYRLWEAKLYPEAETALKSVVDTYPKHRRASFSQNLLGRSYLDEGRPSLASMAFYDSFKKYPDGERAPDSLYYLAQALMKLDKPADACKVYAELDASYGPKITPQMRANVTKGRAAAKCK